MPIIKKKKTYRIKEIKIRNFYTHHWLRKCHSNPQIPPYPPYPLQSHSLRGPSSSSSSSLCSAGWWRRQTSCSSVLYSLSSIPRTNVHNLSSWVQTRTHTQHAEQEEDSRRIDTGRTGRKKDGRSYCRASGICLGFYLMYEL